jgi:hypothetical protein
MVCRLRSLEFSLRPAGPRQSVYGRSLACCLPRLLLAVNPLLPPATFPFLFTKAKARIMTSTFPFLLSFFSPKDDSKSFAKF